MKQCFNCQTELPENANFCHACGAAQKDASGSTSAQVSVGRDVHGDVVVAGRDVTIEQHGEDPSEVQYRMALNWDGKTSLRGFNLAGRDLSDLDLSGADLRGANLNGADLTRTHLKKAKLNNATLIKANLEMAHLEQADLWEADLTDAYFGNARLMGVQCWKTKFTGANLLGADASGGRFWSTDFTGATFFVTRFIDAELSGSFRDAQMRGVDFTGAEVSEEALREAATLRAITLPDGRILYPDEDV